LQNNLIFTLNFEEIIFFLSTTFYQEKTFNDEQSFVFCNFIVLGHLVKKCSIIFLRLFFSVGSMFTELKVVIFLLKAVIIFE